MPDRARNKVTQLGSPGAGLPLGLAALALLVGFDIALGTSVALVGAYAIAPFLTASTSGPRATAIVAGAATAAGAISGLWNSDTGSGGWVAGLVLIAVAGIIAIIAARATARARRAMSRLRLLDRVGRIADGSLPLAETLDNVTDAVVPAFADLCMIDAIREGAVSRIAVRASGAEAERIEEQIRKRTPSTPDWLRDPASQSLDPHFVPLMSDEVLREMANDPDDLAFLRWLRARSYIVAPLVSRARTLGTLTVVRLRRSARLAADDVEFVAALASRIGIALDNAGLFSDLESVERRMDSVMESVAEAVIVHDGEGNLVYANQAASDLVELEPAPQSPPGESGEDVGRFAIRDENGRPMEIEDLPRRRTLRGEDAGPMAFRLRDVEEGRDSWRLEKSTAIRGGSDDVLYVVTTIEDVTAVKQAEFAQRVLASSAEALASAANYEAALEGLSRAVVPQLADWCSVSVPTQDGRLERVAVAERDPAMLELDRLLREGLEVRPGTRLEMADVMRATQPVTAELPANPTPGWVLLKPIMAGGEAIGVMCLINRAGRHAFSSSEIRLGRAVADRAGVAILNSRLATERAQIAEALQHELLPPLLPDVDGWTMAAMYRPAGEQNRAGGDFYDVFEGRDGWVVTVGDVEGHGAEAAALTAMVRYTIRTAAMLDGDVLPALDILNAELRRRDDARLCSVACVSFGSSVEATVVSAGHPLPLLVSAGAVREVGLPGSLLGALEEPQWSPVRFQVARGEELVVYTDGVVEARRDGERFGRERLGSLLRRISSPGETVQRVGDAMDAFAATFADDAAMLVLRREASPALEPASRQGVVEGIE